MVPYTKIINGITRYIDEEVVNKLTGAPRWIIGAGAGIMMSKATNVFNELENNTLIKSMSLINEKDEVDIELIYKELKKQAQKSPMTLNIPMAGALTLNEQDVDKLYNMIMGG